MDLSTFFQKFDQFADAPDAVAKMRELVLELAVRGQLSERHPQDQNDSAWQTFLNEFDNRIYGSDPGPPPPFSIPEEWRWACLEDVGTTKVRNDVEDRTRVSFVPMALISSTYGVPAQTEERTWGEIKKGFTHFAEGDVVMAKITPCFENAKSAVMRNLINGVGAGTTELHVFRRTAEIILPEFVLLYVKTRGFITRGESRMTGSAGQKRVPREYFGTSPFPLPPLAEQKRIVAKVDELMALCDRLEAQQQERETRHAALARASLARFSEAPTPENLNLIFHPSFSVAPSDLRKAILTLAVQGKLVPQDPNDEPAEQLSESESLFEIPTSWQWNLLGTLGLCRTGRTPPTSDPTNYGEGFPFIGPGQITPSGNFTAPEKTITSKALENSTEANVSDILMVCIGGSIGKAAICREPLGFNQQINSVRLKRDLPEFIYLAVTSDYFQEQVLANASGSATPIINKGKWERIPVPIPPLAEQRRIVAKVEQLMALVDALETQLAASRATAANLLSALVAELTSATPATEPESVLIAAEDPSPYHAGKIIDLHSSPEFIRAVLAAQIVDQMHHHATFGRVKLQKVLYLAEYIAELSEIDSRPTRFANGPHDPELLTGVEQKMADAEWYASTSRDNGGYVYRPLAQAGHQQTTFDRLWPQQAKRIQSLITEMLTWKTERCERFATVYAAWNDLIHWNQPVTDAAILGEVLERWHSNKLNIPRASWLETLNWMREHNYIPTGFGRATTFAPQAELSL